MVSTACPARSCVRVLIADSTRMGSQLLAEALHRERCFKIVGCPANWDELASFLHSFPEVVVVAADFERRSGGLEVATRVVGQERRTAVLVLVDDAGDHETIVRAFRAGARGVFSRSQSLPEMCKCLECLAQGQIWASGEQVGYVLEALRHSVVPRFLNADGMARLSKREQEVVRYLCDGLTNRDIALAMGLSEHTVKNHLFRIYAKLGVDKRMEVMFSLLSRAPEREQPQLESNPPGDDAERFQFYLQQSKHSPFAQYMLGKMYSHGRGTNQDPLAAYTWLLRSEKGAIELISKCRAIRQLLGNNLTVEQRKQAETSTARTSAVKGHVLGARSDSPGRVHPRLVSAAKHSLTGEGKQAAMSRSPLIVAQPGKAS